MVPKASGERLIGRIVCMKEPQNKPTNKDSAGELWPQLYLLWRLNKESELKLNVGIYINDDVIVLGCRGRVVHGAEAAALSSRVPELLPRARLLVLDLSQVEAIDGAGLGELVSLLQRARAHGCAMKLAAPSKCVQELLQLTKLHTVFEIHPTLDDAILAARSQVA